MGDGRFDDRLVELVYQGNGDGSYLAEWRLHPHRGCLVNLYFVKFLGFTGFI